MNPRAVITAVFSTMLPLMAQGQVEDFVAGTDLNFLGYRDGVVYWKSDCRDPAAGRGYLRQIPAGNGAIDTLYISAATCVSATRLSSEVARDSRGCYYFVNAAGDVRRASYGFTLATTPNPSALYPNGQVAVGEDYVFWVEEEGEFLEASRIYRTLKTGGGAVELVADHTEDQPGRILEMLVRNDDGIVVYTEMGQLEYIEPIWLPQPAPGHWVWHRRLISTRTTAIGLVQDRLYWVDSREDGREYYFRSASFADLMNPELHHSTSRDIRYLIDQFVFDGTHFYYHEIVGGIGILKRDDGPRASVEITGPLPSPATYLVCDGRYLFWRQDDHTICRLPLNAAAITRDCAATGLEVVQAIQNPDHDAPLIMSKSTFVRLYSQLVNSSDGANEIHFWQGAWLYGERLLPGCLEGVPLEGSPLAPLQEAPIRAAGDSRVNQNDGFLFQLPDTWTQAGQIRLQGVVNPRHALRETRYDNNTTTREVFFESRSPICVAIVPLWHRLGITGDQDPTLNPMFARAETLLPTSDLRVYWRGGGCPARRNRGRAGSLPYQQCR